MFSNTLGIRGEERSAPIEGTDPRGRPSWSTDKACPESTGVSLKQHERGKIVGAAWVVGLATVASRVTGLVRDSLMAFFFGAGPIADAFYVAFRIPNLFRQLFGEGALSASFVPVYTDVLHREGKESAKRFANALFTLLFLVVALVCLLGMACAPQVVKLVALGFKSGSAEYDLAVLLTRWMFPYLLLVCVAALDGGVLNAHDHFFSPAFAPVLLNLAMIAFLWGSPGLPVPILAAAWGVLAGGVLQMLLQWPPLGKLGVLPRFSRDLFHPGVRRVALMMGPAVLGVTVYQINMVVDTMVASFLPAGSITYLWYGNRLVQFPLGVFGIALATAALPTLSQQYCQGRRGDYFHTISFSLSLTAFVGLPAALGMMALADPIMATLFGRGAFGAADVHGAGTALLFYSVGLPFFIGVKILGRAFYAQEDTRTPFLAAIVAMVTNIVFILLLKGPLAHGGLALATSLASALNFAQLAVIFTRRNGGSWMGHGLIPELVKALFAACAMGAAVMAAANAIAWLAIPALPRIAALVGCMALGVVVYCGVATVFRSEGMAALWRKARGKLRSEPS
jgi:putative peptidoglycan lipid II flippase